MFSRFIKVGVTLLISCFIGLAGIAEELPPIYQDTYLEWEIGDKVNVGNSVAITVNEAEMCSYTDFISRYAGTENLLDNGPQHCVVVRATIENISDCTVSGIELSQAISPAYFQYPYSSEEENNPGEYTGWVRCDLLLPTDRNFSVYELNTDFDSTKVLAEDSNWTELIELKDIVLEPGQSVEIIDLNGHVNKARHQAFLSSLAYQIEWAGETENICLWQLSIDLNTDEYVDCPMSVLDAYMMDILYLQDEDVRYEFLSRWGELDGIPMLCEQLKICQEIFGLEPTGIVTQDIVNELKHATMK